MKIITRIAILLLALCLLVAADLPPQLPSSFWGYVNAAPGVQVAASIDGASCGSTRVIQYNGQSVYSLDCAGQHADGARVVFRVGGLVAGYGEYHSGTNTRLDLAIRLWWWRR